MVTYADKVGGVQKGQKHADVLYGWSLVKLVHMPALSWILY